MGEANRSVRVTQPESRAATKRRRQGQAQKRAKIRVAANNTPLALLRNPGDPMRDAPNSCAAHFYPR